MSKPAADLKIAVRKQPAEFQPGEEITGAAQWKIGTAPESVEVRLLWHTSGKGIVDISVVDTVSFDAPTADDTRPFTITAPGAPYSFTGKLITLAWVLELVALPSGDNMRIDLIIAPAGKAIDLRKEDIPD